MLQKFQEMKQAKWFLMKEYKVIKFVKPYKNDNTFIVEIKSN